MNFPLPITAPPKSVMNKVARSFILPLLLNVSHRTGAVGLRYRERQVATEHELLARAKEAEELAKRVDVLEARETWLRVAACYRELAEFARKGVAIR